MIFIKSESESTGMDEDEWIFDKNLTNDTRGYTELSVF